MVNNNHNGNAGVPASLFSLTPEELIRLITTSVIAGVTQLVESLPSILEAKRAEFRYENNKRTLLESNILAEPCAGK